MMVYRCPGPHHAPVGTYEFKGTDNLAEALADGWFLTLPEAMAGVSNQPPTRAELEQKARELGLTFSPRIGDAKLAQRISEAL